MSPRPGLQQPEEPRRRLPRLGDAAPPAPPTAKTKHTIYLQRETGEALKDAVIALAATPATPVGLSEFVDEAVLHYIERMAAAHNQGRPFPPRHRDPRPGRPIS